MPSDDVDLITIIGKPLHLPKIEYPSSKEVEMYHELYINSLTELFDRYKHNSLCKTLEIY